MTAQMTSQMYQGRYANRAQYYDKLIPNPVQAVENDYLDIYRCAMNIYNNCKRDGIQFIDKVYVYPWTAVLSDIKNIAGLARAWGHAEQVIKLIFKWTSSIDKNTIESEITAQLISAAESLVVSLLEVLPAFAAFPLTAKVAKNQPLVDFLQGRCNTYRAAGNPKFYAYDRVIDNIVTSKLVITVQNCKYVRGVGPRIKQHITEFLEGRATPDIAPEQRSADLRLYDDNGVWIDTPIPTIQCEDNRDLVEYLWSLSGHFYSIGKAGRACAWRRAARTICALRENIEWQAEKIGIKDQEIQHHPFIGEIMGDVIREFYRHRSSQGSGQSSVTTGKRSRDQDDNSSAKRQRTD